MSNSDATSSMVEIDFSEIVSNPNVLLIEEQAFLGHINIRGSSDNAKFMRATKQVLGTELPITANTFVEKGDASILWLGPNEWLVVTLVENVVEIVTKLQAALGDTFSAINEVSGGSTVLQLSGSKAQALLLKGCPLDLHHSVFSTGQCAQTVIAKTSMTLWQVDNTPVYKVIVRRSFADYLGLWLLDAAKEYQC